MIGGPSLWNHFPDNVKEVGFIEFFKQILITVVFSQSFEIPAFSSFALVPLTLFDLFVVKNGAKCPTSSYSTPVYTFAMYGTL